MIVNDGSAGYIFDGEPSASWARIDVADDEVTADIQRTEFDALSVAERDHGSRASWATCTARPRCEPGSSSDDDRRRVVVTGMGLVTPLGNDVATTWANAMAGRSGVRTIEAFDPVRARLARRGEDQGLRCQRACSIARSSGAPTATSSSASWPRARRSTGAGLPERFDGDLAERTGVILGTGLAASGRSSTVFNTNFTRGPDRISPFLIPMGIPNIGSGQIAIQFGMTGPNFTTVSACATGGHALGESSEIIRRGDADIMVAGGAEAGIYEPMVGGFAAMRALSTRNDDPEARSAPFDLGRDGFVIAEGAGRSSSSRRSTTPKPRRRRHSPS
jgi:3-oxoacyl-[acyl-carrier-protein] synthase II